MYFWAQTNFGATAYANLRSDGAITYFPRSGTPNIIKKCIRTMKNHSWSIHIYIATCQGTIAFILDKKCFNRISNERIIEIENWWEKTYETEELNILRFTSRDNVKLSKFPLKAKVYYIQKKYHNTNASEIMRICKLNESRDLLFAHERLAYPYIYPPITRLLFLNRSSTCR